MPRLSPWPPLILALVLFWPFPFVAPIHPPNELGRVYQARAIVAEGRLSIDGQMRRHGPIHDLSRYEGRTYPSRAPGVSLVGAGVLWAWQGITGRPVAEHPVAEDLWVLEKVLLAFPTLLVFLLLRRHLRRVSDNRQAVETAALAWALGSAALPYALLLFGHQLAALLLFAGWLAYDRAAGGEDRWVALGGLLHGLALAVEYTVAPVVGALALFAVFGGGRRPGSRLARVGRRAGLGLLGAAVPVGAMLWYHATVFEGPFDTAYQHLVSPVWRAVHETGFLGIHPPRLDWLLRGLGEPGRGLLYFSPWVILAVPGFLLAARRRPRETAAAATVVGLYLAFSASWDPGTWGWVVGPRHLVPMLPFLALPTAATLSWLRERPFLTGPTLAGAATGLVLAGVLLHVLAVVTYPHYPPELDNPPWQLGLPLLLEGYTVHDVGKWLLGRAVWWTALPVLLGALGLGLALGAQAFGRASPRGRGYALGAAVGTCVVVLGLGWGAGRLAGGGDLHPGTRQFVIEHYDPVPGEAVAPPWEAGVGGVRN